LNVLINDDYNKLKDYVELYGEDSYQKVKFQKYFNSFVEYSKKGYLLDKSIIINFINDKQLFDLTVMQNYHRPRRINHYEGEEYFEDLYYYSNIISNLIMK